MRILLIDNYDSFTWNLVQLVGSLDASIEVHVVRNDGITVDEAERWRPDRLLLSPGPCTPKESGVCPALIAHFRGRIPVLGVCLGHQAIADEHGMAVVRHRVLMHGKTSEIRHDGRGIFEGLPDPFVATRYHSLIVDPATVPPEFEVSAWTDDEEIMGLRWRPGLGTAGPMDGVQFHPESFLTLSGPALMANFLGRRGLSRRRRRPRLWYHPRAHEGRRTVSTDVGSRELASGILEEVEADRIVLRPARTEYRIRLALPEGASGLEAMVGKRVRGVIEAKALRIHAAGGGGRFVEPIVGEPRILAGAVLAVDHERGRVLVDVAVPVWLTTRQGQDLDVFREGGLVNCYVESGATFTPV